MRTRLFIDDSPEWDGVIDVRDLFDGIDGRPALSKWAADQANTDCTLAIQAAIDDPNRRPVYLPKGVFAVSSLNIHSSTIIKGAGARKTQLRSLASDLPYLVTMDSGPIDSIIIEDLNLMGNPLNQYQGGFYFYARQPASGYNHGGLWYANIRNIEIHKFTGHGIWLRGGANLYQHPNQFNKFENVVVFVGKGPRASDARALLITGQCAQHTFLNCEFDGTTSTTIGTNIEISREFQNGDVFGGSSIGGNAVGDNAPDGAVNFITCTTQVADRGFVIDRGGVNIDSCYFEALQRAITIKTSSIITKVDKCHFANAGSDGSGGGYIASVDGATSSLSINRSRVTGACDKFINNPGSHRGVIQSGNYCEGDAAGKTVGVTRQAGTNSGTLECYMQQNMLLNSSIEPITTIRSFLYFGDDLTFIVGPGTGDGITLAVGGNITLTGSSKVHIPIGSTFTMTRMDLGAKWVLKSVSGGASMVSLLPPEAPESPGFKGQIATGGGYIYICTDTNTWQRAALSSWTV